jgi:hypothetical protein
MIEVPSSGWHCKIVFPNEVDENRNRPDYIMINGSYFNQNGVPDALLRYQGKELGQLAQRPPYSGFFIATGSRYEVKAGAELAVQPNCDVVLQSGPLLVDPGGKVGVHDNSNRTARTVLGLKGGNLVVISTNDIGLEELARRLVESHIDVAINLDGGPSTALFCNHGGVNRSHGPEAKVPYYLLFTPSE